MAHQAIKDQKEKIIKVDKERLLGKLKNNRQKHIKEYEEALQGYKEEAKDKIQQAYKKSKKDLEQGIERALLYVDHFDPQNPQDYFQIVKGINLELTVPRSYEDKYDTAIDMVDWDIRDTLELTHSEFQCFIRDVWEWTDNFKTVSSFYNKK